MPRAKHVFTDEREIAHMWFHEAQSDARNPQGNFYFDGDTIYSYGGHFPIAKIVRPEIGKGAGQKTVLLTTLSYSATTTRHISCTRGAVGYWNGERWVNQCPVFYVRNPGDYLHSQISDWDKRIKDAQSLIVDAPRGTRQTTKVKLFDAAVKIVSDANAFAEWFGEKRRWVVPSSLEALRGDIETQRDKDATLEKREQAEREQERKAEQAKLDAFHAVLIPAWIDRQPTITYNRDLAGLVLLTIEGDVKNVDEEMSRAYLNKAYLRLTSDGSEVETSMGAKVPVSHAIRAMRLVRAIRSKGETWQTNGHTIHLGHYKLDSVDADGTLRAGCHVIDASEFERFAKVLDGLGMVEDTTKGDSAK